MLQHRLATRDHRHDRLPHHRLEQFLLAREVEIERAARDSRALGDVVEPRRGKAALGKGLECGRDDLRRPLLFAAAPARAFLDCRSAHLTLITNAIVIYIASKTKVQARARAQTRA